MIASKTMISSGNTTANSAISCPPLPVTISKILLRIDFKLTNPCHVSHCQRYYRDRHCYPERNLQ